MDIIKISPDVPDKKIIAGAVKILKQGGIVMYPTDTAYGLAADVKNHKGIEKIFKIKGRMKRKTLPLIVGSLLMASKYVNWTPMGKKLAKNFWPGPLTLVLESRASHFKIKRFVAYHRKIAIRVPDSKIAQMISKKIGGPITSTSANMSGKPECYSAVEFLNQAIGKKIMPDLILDAGRLKKRKPSTIIDASDEKISLVRKGAIKFYGFAN